MKEGVEMRNRGKITGIHAWMAKKVKVVIFRGDEMGCGQEHFPTRASMRRLTRACRWGLGKTIPQMDGWDWIRNGK